ncbi:MAG: hypothetical protein M3Q82_10055 [Actinomycetota bacterium]|nr:hypothetical protein [Actinomycetota bacterium]
MAIVYGSQSTKVLSTFATPAPGFVNGSVRVFAETLALASQATADTIYVGRLPKGAIFLYGIITTDTSLGTSTVAIGIAGATAKYKAAAAFTATETPTLFGDANAMNTTIAADEDVLLTVGTAALPAAGTLQVTLVYAFN